MTVITMSRNELTRLRVLIDVAAYLSQTPPGLSASDEDRSTVYWRPSELTVRMV